MARSSLTARFTNVVMEIQHDFSAQGVRLADMRRAGSLETQRESGFDLDRADGAADEWPLTIERIEHQQIRAIEIPKVAPGASRLRYFLDGSQKTLLVWRIGVVPVVSAFAVAAVLARDGGDCTIVPETLTFSHTWLIPEHVSSPELDRLRLRLRDDNADIVDPMPVRCFQDSQPTAEYFALAGNYGAMVTAAQQKANELRSELERDILRQWAYGSRRSQDGGFIVVDGKLRENIPHAVGLVKSLDMQHLAGSEAEVLFSLPAGYRTSAFRYVGRQTEERESGKSDARTMWYIRLWDAAGMDARHSLVRIEAAHEVADPAEIDRISSWLMAERIPRATQDPRWATLLYPIHFLEEILKRRIAGELTGWPS